MGLIGKAVLLVVVVVALLGAFLYVTDYGVGATITSKGQDSQGTYVVATTQIGGFAMKQSVPQQEWSLVSVGNFVVYHIQSKHVQVYDHQGGALLYSG